MKKKVLRSVSFIVLLGVVLLIGSPKVYAASVTLEELGQGASITVGDKIFFDFRNITVSGTGINVPPSAIEVFGLSAGGPNNDELGLRFQATGWHVDSGQDYDLGFDFSVRRVDGLPLIHDNTLEITGSAEGTGLVTLTEGVTDHADDSVLANKHVYLNDLSENPVDKLVDHQIFTHDAAIVDVSKDFKMIAGLNGSADVSHFDQTFSQTEIPEPGTWLLLGTGLVGLLGYGWRRRKQTAQV